MLVFDNCFYTSTPHTLRTLYCEVLLKILVLPQKFRQKERLRSIRRKFSIMRACYRRILSCKLFHLLPWKNWRGKRKKLIQKNLRLKRTPRYAINFKMLPWSAISFEFLLFTYLMLLCLQEEDTTSNLTDIWGDEGFFCDLYTPQYFFLNFGSKIFNFVINLAGEAAGKTRKVKLSCLISIS